MGQAPWFLCAYKPAGQQSAANGQTIRVSLDVLEILMQTVGELVLTRNQLMQLQRNHDAAPSDYTSALQRLNLITSELQEGVMQTRMQPIGNAWAKFPRLIRDLNLELGKKIELVMEGAETELDRQMLDAIKDPLTHMVRNSCDHGVETPEDRQAAGKKGNGTVTLAAYHDSGHIVITITDDGKGLNPEKIRQKILENGLASPEEAAEMTNKQLFQHIFHAGFSTADKVTAVSGRGVGMDVVRRNIEKIGGHVELESTPGEGSCFTIKLPLTLAIMPVLIIAVQQQTFALPQTRVLEIIRTDNKEASTQNHHAIETLNGAPVLRLRGKLLPLVSLAEVLKLERKAAAMTAADDDEMKMENRAGGALPQQHVVVCEVGSQHFGICVDEVYHTEEIVVKPLSRALTSVPAFSGSTILGDGSVIMILDPNGILNLAGSQAMEDTTQHADETTERSMKDQAVALLVFKIWGAAPTVVPLELVSRLEEINMATVEHAGDSRVVQYRGGLMQLIMLHHSQPFPEEGMQEVIVFSDENRTLGILAEEILDISHCEIQVDTGTKRTGTLGSIVVDGTTCDMLDISHYFTQHFPDWLTTHGTVSEDGSTELAGDIRILLVDDSPFFRKFMAPALTIAGYHVVTAENGQEAKEILEKEGASAYQLVVTDIDMPIMDGVTLTRTFKENPAYRNLPFIALTSHTRDDIADDPGFDGFVTKSEREALVPEIQAVLTKSHAGQALHPQELLHD